MKYVIEHYETYLGMWWTDSFETLEQAEQFKRALEKADYKIREIEKYDK